MLLSALLQDPTLFVPVIALLGLVVGSFLNVVIHRVPLMMDRQWRTECQSLLCPDGETPLKEEAPFSLSFPPSHCPKCQHTIRVWENIPVLSYVALRGRCAACKQRISARYPVVEILTAALSVVLAFEIGPSIELLAFLGLTWTLIALALIDFDTQLLPDSMTLPLVWAGLVVNALLGVVSLEDALWGAVAGYLSLWSIFWVFKLLTGKEGMGYGDFKLLAALGAWMGWQALPMIIVMSSLVGALFGITLIIVRGRDRNIPIPFGPYLATAGWLVMIWGDTISRWYLDYAGIQ